MGFYTMLEKLPLGMVILLCLTIGLAPFNPPHLWEKVVMLSKGQLVRPLDWFDLFLHGVPWLLLLLKLASLLKGNTSSAP
jgi:hypothetical protein